MRCLDRSRIFKTDKNEGEISNFENTKSLVGLNIKGKFISLSNPLFEEVYKIIPNSKTLKSHHMPLSLDQPNMPIN